MEQDEILDELFVQASQQYETGIDKMDVSEASKTLADIDDDDDDDNIFIQASQQYEKGVAGIE